jgi:hypothetical protein
MSRRGFMSTASAAGAKNRATQFVPVDHYTQTHVSFGTLEVTDAEAGNVSVGVRAYDPNANAARPLTLHVLAYYASDPEPDVNAVLASAFTATTSAQTASDPVVTIAYTGLAKGYLYKFKAVVQNPFGSRTIPLVTATSTDLPLIPYSVLLNGDDFLNTVTIDPSIALSFDDGFTVHLRYYRTQLNGSSETKLLQLGLDSTGTDRVIFQMSSAVQMFPWSTLNSGEGIAINTWWHIDLVCTATQVKWYVDGVLVETDSVSTAGRGTNGWLGVGPMWIGNDPNTPHTDGSHPWFHGYYNEVATYQSALTDAQILALYNEGAPFNLLSVHGDYDAAAVASLATYYRFNNDTLDYGPHGRHLTRNTADVFTATVPS